MSSVVYLALNLLAGWLGGKAYVTLMRARVTGTFMSIHWVIFVASIAGAMLFARFVIGGARHISDLPDFAVGLGAVVMFAVFAWTSKIFRGR